MLQTASDSYVKALPGGNPGWGPAVDGNLVQQEAGLELAAGNVVKGIESVINSHVADEAALFTPADASQSTIDTVLSLYFSSSPDAIRRINEHYPTPSTNSYTKLKTIYRSMIFTCHNRFISQGYLGKTYNLQYGRGSGLHGTDLAADFYDPNNLLTPYTLLHLGDTRFDTFATQFQKYLLSHARTGDPNVLRDPATIKWPIVEIGRTLGNVMNASDNGFALFDDPVTVAGECDFWRDILAEITRASSQ
jgi:carboxylesterase type B